MESVLVLARHGQTRENAEGRWQGRSDSPLTPDGRHQVLALGERLRLDGPWAAIYTSPLGRAVETARLIAASLDGLPLQEDPRLIEYDFGAWDGLTVAELKDRGFWAAATRYPEFAPPGGEPVLGAARRVVAALSDIAAAHRGARAVVVGHGLSLAVALALMLENDVREAPRYTLPNGGLALLGVGDLARLLKIDPVASCELG